MLFQKPTLLFNREKNVLLEVSIETIDNFNGDFGRHEHTLQNIPIEWFQDGPSRIWGSTP